MQRIPIAVIAAALAGLAIPPSLSAEQSQENNVESKIRVGTFDSRALALVYYRSPLFDRHMAGLRAEYQQAKAAKDQKRRKELEAASSDPTWPDSGWPPSAAQQKLIHKQGFSTWPVDNILQRIEGDMAEIAEKADVDVIVSKWDIVYQGPEVEFVDVTDLMVGPFGPDEATLQMVKEMAAHEPVPLEELAHDH